MSTMNVDKIPMLPDTFLVNFGKKQLVVGLILLGPQANKQCSCGSVSRKAVPKTHVSAASQTTPDCAYRCTKRNLNVMLGNVDFNQCFPKTAAHAPANLFYFWFASIISKLNFSGELAVAHVFFGLF